MAGEHSQRDANGSRTLLAVDPTVASGADQTENVRRLNTRDVSISGDTFHALVTTSDSASSAGTEVNDAEAVDTDTDGRLVLGSERSAGAPTTARVLHTDSDGDPQVDVLSQPARESGTDSIDAVQSGSWSVDVGAALPAGSNLVGKVQMRDPGDTVDLGDATNPVRIDPTGSTTQPVERAQDVEDSTLAHSKITSATTTTVVSGVGGESIYIRSVLVQSALTAGSEFEFKNGSTSLFVGFQAADGGGYQWTFAKPVALTAGNDLDVVTPTGTSSSNPYYVTVEYYQV